VIWNKEMNVKAKKKVWGGIGEKYLDDMRILLSTMDGMEAEMTEVMRAYVAGDVSRVDVIGKWLNGPMRVIEELKPVIDRLETAVKNDMSFNQQDRTSFTRDVIDSYREKIAQLQKLSVQVMSGAPVSDL
jgi:hypothetical protein